MRAPKGRPLVLRWEGMGSTVTTDGAAEVRPPDAAAPVDAAPAVLVAERALRSDRSDRPVTAGVTELDRDRERSTLALRSRRVRLLVTGEMLLAAMVDGP